MRAYFRNLWRAFRHRNYRLFFSGQAISLIGTWLQQVAQAWLVWRLTGSGALLGLLAVAQTLPAFLFAPAVGVLADRYDRRRLVMLTQFVSALTALALGCLTLSGAVTPLHILLVALLLGGANAVDMPVRQALVVELVGRRDVATAVALNSTMFNGARLLGPAVAGALIPFIGEGWCFILNALSYLPVLIGLAAVRPLADTARGTATKPFLLSLREGLRYVRRTPPIALQLLILAIASCAGMPYLVLLPVYAARVLQGGADTLGLLLAASGAGAFIGALLLAGQRRAAGLPRLTVLGGLLFGCALCALAGTSRLALALPVLLLTGYGFMVQHASQTAFVQAVVNGRLRGRVMAVYIMIYSGAMPLGGFLTGWGTDRYGVTAMLAVCGLLVGGGTLLCGRALLRATTARPL